MFGKKIEIEYNFTEGFHSEADLKNDSILLDDC